MNEHRGIRGAGQQGHHSNRGRMPPQVVASRRRKEELYCTKRLRAGEPRSNTHATSSICKPHVRCGFLICCAPGLIPSGDRASLHPECTPEVLGTFYANTNIASRLRELPLRNDRPRRISVKSSAGPALRTPDSFRGGGSGLRNDFFLHSARRGAVTGELHRERAAALGQ